MAEFMTLKVKILDNNAVIPSYANEGDNGLDLTATSIEYFDDYIEYKTGIAVEIEQGYVGLIFPRSSITKKEIMLKNSVGVIDSSYRGEISFRFQRISGIRSKTYNVGDRIGQLVIIPAPKQRVVVVSELSETKRNHGSYGSTGS